MRCPLKKCKSKKDEVKRPNHKFFKALNNGCSLRLRRVIHGGNEAQHDAQWEHLKTQEFNANIEL